MMTAQLGPEGYELEMSLDVDDFGNWKIGLSPRYQHLFL